MLVERRDDFEKHTYTGPFAQAHGSSPSASRRKYARENAP
jgi:hypothetical protein